MSDPFEQATTDPNHVPKFIPAAGGAEPPGAGAGAQGAQETLEDIAAKEKAASEAASGAGGAGATPADENTPDKIFGEDFKDKKWDDVKTEFQTAKQKIAEFEAQAEATKNAKPSYANETVAAYDAWVRNGGDPDFGIFERVRSVDAEKMDGIEAIIAQKIIEHPEYKGMEAELKQELVDQYRLESTEAVPLTEQQIKFNKTKLEVQAKQSKEFLAGLKGKMQVQAPDPEAQTKAIKQRTEAWTPVINKVIDNFKTLPIIVVKKDEAGNIVKDKDGNVVTETFAEYQVPEHLQKKYKEDYVKMSERFADVGDRSEGMLGVSARKEFIFDNFPYLMSFALQKQATELQDFYDKKYGGGTTPPTPGAKGNPGASSSSKETMDKFNQQMG